jgi:alkanesulfonate monooxygenase SsuD/methylene tetrahydromethanopterin reductase-like flavin-dependent oxidoreductase (luciferase family)
MWNAIGSAETLRHKVDVLTRHCATEGRDPAEIEFTVGCKPIIRDTEAEARSVWEAQMSANKTPMSDVENDPSFWVGTAEQVADRIRQYQRIGFATVISEMAAPYDNETLERLIREVKPMVES